MSNGNHSNEYATEEESKKRDIEEKVKRTKRLKKICINEERNEVNDVEN